MAEALRVAVRQWCASARRCVEASAALADAQAQLAHSERDLLELGQSLEALEGPGVAARVSELVNDHAPTVGVNSVTMPVVPAGPMVAPDTEGSPAQIVLEYLRQQRQIGAP
jgi:hypothetical protein